MRYSSAHQWAVHSTLGGALGRHLGKDVPRNFSVVVENVTGADGLTLAGQVYKSQRADGLTIATFIGSLLIGQILGRPGIEFAARSPTS